MDLLDGFLTLLGAAVGIATQLRSVPDSCTRCYGEGRVPCSHCEGHALPRQRGCFMCYDRGQSTCHSCSGTGEGSGHHFIWSQT